MAVQDSGGIAGRTDNYQFRQHRGYFDSGCT